MEEWKVVGVAIEGQPIDLEGLNPWKLEWRETQEDAIELLHPLYPC